MQSSKFFKIIFSIFIVALRFNLGATIEVPENNIMQTFLINSNSYDVGLIYVSEDSRDVSSMFGHSSIIFINKENFLNSIVISFLAEVDRSDHFISYVFNGVFGKYEGRFHKMPLFLYVNEYHLRERRNIFVYKFKNININFLVENILKQEKVLDNYYFLTNNCSSLLDKVLANTLDFKDGFVKNDRVYQPYNLIEKYLSNLELLKVFYSLDVRFYKNLHDVSDLFKEQVLKNEPAEPSNRSEERFYRDYYDYVSSNQVPDGKKIIDNFQPIEDYDDLELGKLSIVKPISKFIIGIESRKNFIDYIFKAELLSKDLIDNDFLGNSLKELKMLSADIYIHEQKVHLDNIKLLKTMNIVDFSWPFYNLSSAFETGYKKKYISSDSYTFIDYKLGISFKNDYYASTFFIGPNVEYSNNEFDIFDSFNILVNSKIEDLEFKIGNELSFFKNDFDSNYFFEFSKSAKNLTYSLNSKYFIDQNIAVFGFSIRFNSH